MPKVKKNTTKKKAVVQKKPVTTATGTSTREIPITGRTYQLETKRKGTTKGYRSDGGKYYKTVETKWKHKRLPGGQVRTSRVK